MPGKRNCYHWTQAVLSGVYPSVNNDHHHSSPHTGQLLVAGLSENPRPLVAGPPSPPSGALKCLLVIRHQIKFHHILGTRKCYPVTNTDREKIQGTFHEPSTLPGSTQFLCPFKNHNPTEEGVVTILYLPTNAPTKVQRTSVIHSRLHSSQPQRDKCDSTSLLLCVKQTLLDENGLFVCLKGETSSSSKG